MKFLTVMIGLILIAAFSGFGQGQRDVELKGNARGDLDRIQLKLRDCEPAPESVVLSVKKIRPLTPPLPPDNKGNGDTVRDPDRDMLKDGSCKDEEVTFKAAFEPKGTHDQIKDQTKDQVKLMDGSCKEE